jgi:hypothetical protein
MRRPFPPLNLSFATPTLSDLVAHRLPHALVVPFAAARALRPCRTDLSLAPLPQVPTQPAVYDLWFCACHQPHTLIAELLKGEHQPLPCPALPTVRTHRRLVCSHSYSIADMHVPLLNQVSNHTLLCGATESST